MSAALLLAACSSSPESLQSAAWTAADGGVLPPPTYVELTGPAFAMVRTRYDLQIEGALESEGAILVVGPDAGDGPCIRRLGGYCLGLEEPVSRYADAVVDGSGRAVFELVAPPWPGTRYCYQAVVPRGPSGIATALSDIVCVDYCSTEDADGDGVCNAFDTCPDGDDRRDRDADGICDALDLCPEDVGEPDEDGDGICDPVDVCPGGVDADTDGDGVLDGCDSAPLANEVRWGDFVYAAIDDIPVDASYGEFSTCQTTPLPLPEGWEVAPYEAGIEDLVFDHGWSTHCMITADGCSWGTFNYGRGDCGCGVMGTDGVNYWADSCSRRMMIRRPG